MTFMTSSLLVSVPLLFLFLHTTAEAQVQRQRQKIVIGSAQSLVPLAEKFSDRFRKENPGIEIEIRGGGSNYAVNAARSRQVDIGLAARHLDSKEKAGLHVEAFGQDSIVLLSYPGNPVSSLTLAQLRAIYTGKITQWSQVGGEDQGIVSLTRERGAAIRAIFLQHLFGDGFDGQEKAFMIRASKDKILRTVKRITGSVAYGIVRLEEAQSHGVRVLAVDGKLPTEKNIRQGLYPFVRPQYVIVPVDAAAPARRWVAGFLSFAGGKSAQ